MSAARRFLVAVFLVAWAGVAVGQAPLLKKEDVRDAVDPAMTQAELNRGRTAMARFKYDASRATVRDLARARLDAARGEYECRYKEFLAGRGTLEFLQAASLRWLEAELALADGDTARLAAYERYWFFSWMSDAINQARYESGRLPTQDYLQTRYYRLDAEIRLLEARARSKPGRSLVPRGIELRELAGYWDQAGIGAEQKLFARAKFEALRADPRELARARIEAPRGEIEARYKEFLAGRGTLDFLQDASQRWLEAELALAENDAARLAAYERHLLYARESAVTNQARYESGRIPINDFAESRYLHLQAEIWLARAKRPKGRTRVPIAVPEAAEFEDDRNPPLVPPSYARAKWDAAHPDNGELHKLLQKILEDDPTATRLDIGTLLNKAKLRVAWTAYEARWKDFEAGRGTLPFLLTAALRVLESEQDLSTKPADHIAALDRHFARMRQIEAINQARYDTGRIPIQDTLQSRYFRLDAEIQLLQARAKQAKK